MRGGNARRLGTRDVRKRLAVMARPLHAQAARSAASAKFYFSHQKGDVAFAEKRH